MNLVLADNLSHFITAELAEGHFSSAHEMIEEGLHLLEEKNIKLQTLRSLINEGKKSELLDGDEAMKKMKSKIF